MNIGYIGLGLMGRPCVLNLIKGGHSLFVWARRPESAAEVMAKGAVLCGSSADVAAKADLVFLNVTNTADVREVIFGANGLASSGKRGLTIVDMSTISATATRAMGKELAALGMELVDAPVSGGTVGAIAGTLTFMVGASPAVFERIKPVLACMGSTITRIGDCGAGQVAKSCNQIVITGAIAAVAEAVNFARANGVDPNPVREALMGGFAGSRILELHGKRIIDNSFEPGFKAALHCKDIGIVEEIAKELGLNMPVTDVGFSLLRKTVEQGYGDLDSSAMCKVIEKA